MRNVNASLFISVDGVVESPDQWQFDNFDEDMMNMMMTEIGAQDTVLLGRVTYDEWAPYWPTAQHDQGFADYINNVPKYVFSSTLTRADWNQTTLVKTSLTEQVKQLKQQTGQNIGVAGSPSIVRALVQADLLDNLTLLVHPVVAGTGKRLFPDGSALKRLALADVQKTRSGVAVLRYQPKR